MQLAILRNVTRGHRFVAQRKKKCFSDKLLGKGNWVDSFTFLKRQSDVLGLEMQVL